MEHHRKYLFIATVAALSTYIITASTAEKKIDPTKVNPPTVTQPNIKPPKVINPNALTTAERNALRKQLNQHRIDYRKYMDKLKDYRDRVADEKLIRNQNTARARTNLRSQNHEWEGVYDCNDFDPAINPTQNEVCDGIDNDCDGDVDENVTANLFLDADGDGWGDPSKPIKACWEESGYVSRAHDCDDQNFQIFPGSHDVEGDGIDANCDGKDG